MLIKLQLLTIYMLYCLFCCHFLNIPLLDPGQHFECLSGSRRERGCGSGSGSTAPGFGWTLNDRYWLQVSFDLAEYTAEVDGVGTLRLLDAIRTCGLSDHVRFYQVTLQNTRSLLRYQWATTSPIPPHLPQGSWCAAGSLWNCRTNLRVERETYPWAKTNILHKTH